MAYPFDDFVLQLPAHGREIGVIAGDPDQQMPVIFRVFLGVAEHLRIHHVDLQGGAAVAGVCLEKGFEFFPVAGKNSGGIVAAQGFADGVGVGRRTIYIRAIGRADGVG